MPDGPAPTQPVVELVGVYDADGGIRGEVSYVIGHLLHRRECALCDITHTWRRKPAWDAMVARLGVPVTLRHRNEVDAALSAALDAVTLPVVLGRTADGPWRPVLTRDELRSADGEVAAFEALVRAKLDV